jgi:carbon-monoxide dehydrogenase large subunit
MNYIGQSIPRREDARFLTGAGTFVGDITLEGMVHAALLRSPHAHARIRAIDASAALANSGVRTTRCVSSASRLRCS